MRGYFNSLSLPVKKLSSINFDGLGKFGNIVKKANTLQSVVSKTKNETNQSS